MEQTQFSMVASLGRPRPAGAPKATCQVSTQQKTPSVLHALQLCPKTTGCAPPPTWMGCTVLCVPAPAPRPVVAAFFVDFPCRSNIGWHTASQGHKQPLWTPRKWMDWISLNFPLDDSAAAEFGALGCLQVDEAEPEPTVKTCSWLTDLPGQLGPPALTLDAIVEGGSFLENSKSPKHGHFESQNPGQGPEHLTAKPLICFQSMQLARRHPKHLKAAPNGTLHHLSCCIFLNLWPFGATERSTPKPLLTPRQHDIAFAGALQQEQSKCLDGHCFV